MMRPLLNPMVSISTAITMIIDSIKLMPKVPSESPTRSGWLKTLWTSTPAGKRVSCNCCMVRSTSAPTLMMSASPDTAIRIPMERFPS